jgi:hypothetical protein
VGLALASPARADDDRKHHKRHKDYWKHQDKYYKEQQKRAAEYAREQQKRAAEYAREQQKRAAEYAYEQQNRYDESRSWDRHDWPPAPAYEWDQRYSPGHETYAPRTRYYGGNGSGYRPFTYQPLDSWYRAPQYGYTAPQWPSYSRSYQFEFRYAPRYDTIPAWDDE